MKVNNAKELLAAISNCCAKIDGNKLKVTDPAALRGHGIDRLIINAVFGKDAEIRGTARWVIKAAALELGLWPASIQGLYDAMGRSEVRGYTVPAINIRGLTYDVARAVFHTAIRNNTGAFIFEIARSEIDYTFQRPAEYSTALLAAGIKEGYKGPVFIQGDHFQVSAKKYKADPVKEIEGLKNLIAEAIDGQFYNIDIDTSTLVDLSKPTILEQQRLNFEVGAELCAYVRSREPEGVTISVGGEIGEVGEKNSTVEELDAYMEGFEATLKKINPALRGISKVSVQTGTSHGGVPLPDGTVAKVKLDFDTLEKLSHRARERYGMSGAVQHGASTLPEEAFDRFPGTTASEIHLATGFQNMIFDSEHFPEVLRDQIYDQIKQKFRDEWKDGQTVEQFIYKTRKKGFGLAKEDIWRMEELTRAGIREELEKKFDFLFHKLAVGNNHKDVDKHITPVKIAPVLEKEIAAAGGYKVEAVKTEEGAD
ncbi:MAG: class II fructose-bisphosphate aldolase [Nitrospinae bacterium]|nr:class II fructose-bisphosphate aldolase [Nitrospinota bacterium]